MKLPDALGQNKKKLREIVFEKLNENFALLFGTNSLTFLDGVRNVSISIYNVFIYKDTLAVWVYSNPTDDYVVCLVSQLILFKWKVG